MNATQSEFSSVEQTGGEKTHTLTVDEMASHRHGMECGALAAWGTTTSVPMIDQQVHMGDTVNTGLSFLQNDSRTNYTGSSSAHNNLQPYITCYMWKRIA